MRQRRNNHKFDLTFKAQFTQKILEDLMKKVEKKGAKGNIVWGMATTEALDKQGDITSSRAISEALPEYSKWRNIREMHQAKTVGVAKHLIMLPKGLLVGAEITDRECIKKIESGMYGGFSIGGIIHKREQKFVEGRSVSVITKLTIAEISIVDQPANPETGFIFETKERKDKKLFEKWFGKSAPASEDDSDIITDVSSHELLQRLLDESTRMNEIIDNLLEICEKLDCEIENLSGRVDALESRFTQKKSIMPENRTTSKWSSVVRLFS